MCNQVQCRWNALIPLSLAAKGPNLPGWALLSESACTMPYLTITTPYRLAILSDRRWKDSCSVMNKKISFMSKSRLFNTRFRLSIRFSSSFESLTFRREKFFFKT